MKVMVFTKKKLGIFISCFAVIALVFSVAIREIAVSTSAQNKLTPIYCVETDKKKVAISFDAAWGNDDTQMLIDILKKYNIKATFFLIGQWVDKYPESVKALSDAGMSIQNHSDTHPYLTQLSEAEIKNQIEECNKKIEKITNKRPVLIRPPFGDYNNTLIKSVYGMNMYTIQWDVDSLDWKNYDAKRIYDNVVPKVKNGSIVLFHNAGLHTPEALPSIIEALLDKGFEFVTIDQLIYKNNYTIDPGGKQILNIGTTEPTTIKKKS